MRIIKFAIPGKEAIAIHGDRFLPFRCYSRIRTLTTEVLKR